MRATRPITASMTLLAAGCALGTASPPEVQVESVELRGIGLLDQAFAVVLCVTNPNLSELAFQRVTVALDVAGLPLAAGASDLPVLLPPLESTAVPFTIATTVQNIGPQLLAIARDGELDYRLHGTVTLAGALRITLPFSRSGQLGPVDAEQALLTYADGSLTAARCPPSPKPDMRRL